MLLTIENIKTLDAPALERCAAHLVRRQSFLNPNRQIYKLITEMLQVIRTEIESRHLDAVPIELALIAMGQPFKKAGDTILISE